MNQRVWSGSPSSPSSPSCCSVTLLKSSNGSGNLFPGVEGSSSAIVALIAAASARPGVVLLIPISMLETLSFTWPKLIVSVARPLFGIIGGFICRRRAHWVVRKKGWVFTSEAPAREPIRRSSSLISSLRIRDLQRLQRVNLVTPSKVLLEGDYILWYLRDARVFGKEGFVSKDIGKGNVASFALERRRAVEHFVDQNS